MQRLIPAIVLLLSASLATAQHHGGHGGIGGIPGGSGRPTGVDEKDSLKDFHDAMAVQATAQQIAEFQEVVKLTNSAADKVSSFRNAAGKPGREGVSPLDQALDAARTATKKFEGGFSEPQKSGLKDVTKRLEKADADLEQETKRLDQAMQAESAAAEISARTASVQKALTDFSEIELALGREMGITLASGHDVAFTLPEVKTPVTFGRRKILVGTSGTLLQTQAEGDLRTFQLALTADVSDLQQIFTEVMSGAFERQKACGERLSVQNAAIVSAAPAGSVVMKLHYERWSCIQGISSELAEAEGTVELKVIPAVENGALVVRAEFKRIDASGMLAESLRSGDLGDDLRDKVAKTVLSALQAASDVKTSLPAALQQASTLQSARFEEPGIGGLKVMIEGQARISNEQANALAEQLNQKLAAQSSMPPTTQRDAAAGVPVR